MVKESQPETTRFRPDLFAVYRALSADFRQLFQADIFSVFRCGDAYADGDPYLLSIVGNNAFFYMLSDRISLFEAMISGSLYQYSEFLIPQPAEKIRRIQPDETSSAKTFRTWSPPSWP